MGNLSAQIEAKTASKSDLEKQAQALASDVARLSRSLAKLSEESGLLLGRNNNLNQSSSSKSKESEEEQPICPICLGIPRHKIFSCTKCDTALCNACQSPLDSCPICRMEFTAEDRPRRNRWAEKLVLVTRANKAGT